MIYQYETTQYITTHRKMTEKNYNKTSQHIVTQKNNNTKKHKITSMHHKMI